MSRTKESRDHPQREGGRNSRARGRGKAAKHKIKSMERLGFTTLREDRCVRKRGDTLDSVVYVSAHGDDILAIGRKTALQKFKTDISRHYELK